jgi:hypothetical protein
LLRTQLCPEIGCCRPQPALTAQGFEVKTAMRDAVVLQKGAEVYWCSLQLANTSPLSYFAVR